MKKSEKAKLKKEIDDNFKKAVEDLDELTEKFRTFFTYRLYNELQLFYNFLALLVEEED